jgi:hypothetical protein
MWKFKIAEKTRNIVHSVQQLPSCHEPSYSVVSNTHCELTTHSNVEDLTSYR